MLPATVAQVGSIVVGLKFSCWNAGQRLRQEELIAIVKAGEANVNTPTTVEIDPKNILTLSQLATLEPAAIKAIMEHRLTKELNWTTYQLARAYGSLKEGRADVNPSRYTTTVTQVLEKPETARWNTVCLVLAAMGLLVQVVALNPQVYPLTGPRSS